jgi:hypothetical protein
VPFLFALGTLFILVISSCLWHEILLAYQKIAHIQEWQAITPELEMQFPKNQESFP